MTHGALALRAVSLSKTFGTTRALHDLSFEVKRGEVIGLLGPNGAGKTTALKLFLGMLRPTSGTAEVLGVSSTTRSLEVKRLLGYTPDEPAFYDFLTGKETVEFVARVRGLDRGALWGDLAGAMEALDFGDALSQLTSGYSHGTKKKLALLLALAHRPSVLLLDEPTNGLDPPTAAKVRDLLKRLADDGAAVLVSTHLLDMADRLCGRVLILHRGGLLADGTPREIRERAGLGPERSLEDAFLALAT